MLAYVAGLTSSVVYGGIALGTVACRIAAHGTDAHGIAVFGTVVHRVAAHGVAAIETVA